MKKVFVAVMALVMIFAVAAFASAEDKDLGMTDNGGIQVSALDGYDELVITVQNTNETSGRTGWGIGGICFGGWSVDDAFACTPTDLPAGGTESFTFAVADILAKCEEEGCDGINLNFYNDCKIASVVLKAAPAVEEPETETEEKDLGRVGNGGIAVADFQDYDKLLVTVKNTGDAARAGWGIGGLCFNNSWSADEAFSPKATSLDPGAECTFEFSIADILAKCAETGDTSVNLCYYNNCEVVSAVAVREVEVVVPTPTPEEEEATPTPEEEEATPTPEEEEPTAAPTEAPAEDNASDNDSAPTTGDAVSFAILFGAAVIAMFAVVAVKKSRA